MSTLIPPSSILIIGAGEFGIATARALVHDSKYSNCKITILEASPELPNPSGSSVDVNRIVRADYAKLPYAKLAVEALKRWRDTSDAGWGGQGRYHQPGMVLTANKGGSWYVQSSLENMRKLAGSGLEGLEAKDIEELADQDAIRRAAGHPGVSGETGYVNWGAGWANAEAVVRYAIESLVKESEGRVELRTGSKVRRLLFEPLYLGDGRRGRCTGAALEDGSCVTAALVILAAGAWSPSLVDLRGRAIATGQTLAYLNISEKEQRALATRPIVFNLSTGIYIIPPQGKELKVAHTGYGYRRLRKVSFTQDGPLEEVSVPENGLRIPAEAEQRCRKALADLIPELGNRQFSRTRICWYCDTPDGDFLIDYHPSYDSLFLATGGSGHAFKLIPVIGDLILAAIERRLDPELKKLWSWRTQPVEDFVAANDGSRSGPKGRLLDDETYKPLL